MSVEIKLFRSNRIYRPNEPLEGKVVINLSSSISHQGIRLKISGSVNLQVRGGSAGIVESIYGVIKPIPIVNKSVEVQKSGRIGSGTTEIPFSVVLKDRGEEQLEKFYETFHGGNISIQYLATIDVTRGYLQKSLSATMEFSIESQKDTLPEKPISPEMVFFYITQDTQRHLLLPELKSGGFRITGKVCSQCSLVDPIGGELTVEASAVPIQSIDIHLLRVESILIGEKIATETSLIQTIQIADGDVCRGLTLPIYIILPRLLTCPTIFAGPFSIEFKMTVIVTFQSELSKLHPKSDFQTPRSWYTFGIGADKVRQQKEVVAQLFANKEFSFGMSTESAVGHIDLVGNTYNLLIKNIQALNTKKVIEGRVLDYLFVHFSPSDNIRQRSLAMNQNHRGSRTQCNFAMHHYC